MTKRRITCLCLAVLLLLPMVLTGCGKKTEKALGSYTELNGTLCETQTVKMAGSNYELTWVKDRARFVLKDTVSGNEFYSTPEWGESRETCSPLVVHYYDEKDNLSSVDGLTDCVDYYYSKNSDDTRSAYSVEPIENGFRATYSFPEAKLAVAVEYLLTTDGMVVSIPVERLQESTNKIYEIQLAPYLVSATNDVEDSDSYLVVPSGGGAVIEAKRSGKVKEYYEAVYGEDQSEPVTLQSRIQSQIYLPVFGATTVTTRDNDLGDDSWTDQKIGMLGVIEEGADCAMVYAKTGGEDEVFNQFSCVYASFCIRSKEKVVQQHTHDQAQRYDQRDGVDERSNGADQIVHIGGVVEQEITNVLKLIPCSDEHTGLESRDSVNLGKHEGQRLHQRLQEEQNKADLPRKNEHTTVHLLLPGKVF